MKTLPAKDIYERVLDDAEGDARAALLALADGEYLGKIGADDAEQVEAACDLLQHDLDLVSSLDADYVTRNLDRHPSNDLVTRYGRNDHARYFPINCLVTIACKGLYSVYYDMLPADEIDHLDASTWCDYTKPSAVVNAVTGKHIDLA